MSSKLRFRSVPFFPTLCLLLAFVTAVPLRAAERVDLNGDWRFRIDREGQGEAQGWPAKLPDDTTTVRVPHTWNIGKYDDYEGVAWYFRSFALPQGQSDRHVELHFAATFYRSHVWLNGKLLGEHEGGHTPYWFDISSNLRPGDNFVAVEIDNRPTAESIPGLALKLQGQIWYDWWHYGGIVRDVWLTGNQAGLIRRQRITSAIGPDSAEIKSEVFVENIAPQKMKFLVSASVYSPEGKIVSHPDAIAIEVAAASSARAEIKTTITQPQLWGLDHPDLYNVAIELRDTHGRLLDTKSDNFGLRTIQIRDRHLFLNRDRVRLTGMTRHEDSPWEGLAETAGTIKNDYDAMEQLHVRLTRPVHYPQNEQILDYADRHGILLIPETPMWQFSEAQMKNPRVIALAQQMMKEMIEADENHPSIFAWSVCNESATTTTGGRAYADLMRDWVHQLDPGRFVSYADSELSTGPDPATEAANDVDFIMMNEYFGSWHGGDTAALASRLDQIGRDYPTKMVIISEFGYPGIFSPNTLEADKARISIIESQLAELEKHDFVAGAIFWCYQDYKSHQNLWPGHQEGYVDHGLVDEYRQHRPSFDVWEKRNEPVTFANGQWEHDRDDNLTAFSMSVAGRGLDQLPSYALRNYSAHWELRDPEGTVLASGEQNLPEIGAQQIIHGTWGTVKPPPVARLRLEISDPKGEIVAATTLESRRFVVGGQTIEQMKQTPPQ